MASGYTYCACRDCMDTSITSDGNPSLCLLCEEADCNLPDLPGRIANLTGDGCQREDAYEFDVPCK